ncbi:MAG: putative Ig domain-containing protein [Candidatus Sumerlaeota bacterium]|nr:putative Ig domain-containing protein [Candidatus Sumerlaeota bacterium]
MRGINGLKGLLHASILLSLALAPCGAQEVRSAVSPLGKSPLAIHPGVLGADATPKPTPDPTLEPHASPEPTPTSSPSPWPMVQFASGNVSGYENQTPAEIMVMLNKPFGKTVTVNYAATSGSAVNGADYVLPPGTVTFAPGQMYRMLKINIIDDHTSEPYKTIEITLSAPSNAILGDNSRIVYGIHDGAGPILPPIIDRVPNVTVLADAPYIGPLPSLVQGTQPITWTLVAAPSDMTIDPETGVTAWAHPALAVSPCAITLRASNAAGSNDVTWLITISPVAIAPVIIPISDASITAGNPYTGPAPRLTQGTLPLVWSLISAPDGMTINEQTGVVFWPLPTNFGSPFSVMASAANSAGADSVSWDLAVLLAGNVIPPQIASIVDETIIADVSYTGPLPILTSGTQPVSWSLIDGPPGMFINAQTGVVSWTSPTIEESPCAVTIQATNAAGMDQQTWELEVVEAADAPLIKQMPDTLVEENEEYGSADPEMLHGTDPIVWTLLQGPEGMTIDSDTGAVYWSSPTIANSPYSIVIRATNPEGSAQMGWKLTVLHFDDPKAAYDIVYRINGKTKGALNRDYIASAADGIAIIADNATERDTLSITRKLSSRALLTGPMIRCVAKTGGVNGFARLRTEAPIRDLDLEDGPLGSLIAVNAYISRISAGAIGSVRMAARQSAPAHTTILAGGDPLSENSKPTIQLTGVVLDNLEAPNHAFSYISLSTKSYRVGKQVFITTSGVSGMLRSAENPEVDFNVLEAQTLSLRGASLDTDVLSGAFGTISAVGLAVKIGKEIVPLPANIRADKLWSLLDSNGAGSLRLTAEGGNISIDRLNAAGEIRRISSRKKQLGAANYGGSVTIGVAASGYSTAGTSQTAGQGQVNIVSVYASNLIKGVFIAGAQEPDSVTGETSATYTGTVKFFTMDPKGPLKAEYQLYMQKCALYPSFFPASIRDPKLIITMP